MGRLTTHVLDIASGRPAAGLVVELWREAEAWQSLGRFTTNAEGRLDKALLQGDDFTFGIYELRFFAGDYLKGQGVSLTEPPFLDVIPIRFGLADETAHYHVPLLLSPYGYSTYRGS